MTNVEQARELRFQLASLTDQLLLVKENPVWQSVVATEPFLETVHKQAVDSVDHLWWRWRQTTAGTESEVPEMQAIEIVQNCPF